MTPLAEPKVDSATQRGMRKARGPKTWNWRSLKEHKGLPSLQKEVEVKNLIGTVHSQDLDYLITCLTPLESTLNSRSYSRSTKHVS